VGKKEEDWRGEGRYSGARQIKSSMARKKGAPEEKFSLSDPDTLEKK